VFDIELQPQHRQIGYVPNVHGIDKRLPLLPGMAAFETVERVVRPKVVPLPDFGVVVFESRHGPGFVGELQDNFSKFLLIIAGQAQWAAADAQIAVRPDSLVHIPCGLAHRQQDTAHDPVVLYAIHYRPGLLPEFLSSALSERGLVHWNLPDYGPSMARAVRSEFQEMLFEQGDKRQGWEWVLCSRLVELSVRAVRICQQDQQGRPLFIKGTDSTERVARYALQLQTQFYLPVTVDDAAVATGLSRRQFTELFRKVTGESLKQYIHRMRLDHSRKLLLQTEKTVTAAAFESGFEDLSYFNHAFRKAYSDSPQAFRQKHGLGQGVRNP
jgi:AraC-like DNA-binding protein/mannose-6-phosphate isomerase-like protein (cupin superfamily)